MSAHWSSPDHDWVWQQWGCVITVDNRLGLWSNACELQCIFNSIHICYGATKLVEKGANFNMLNYALAILFVSPKCYSVKFEYFKIKLISSHEKRNSLLKKSCKEEQQQTSQNMVLISKHSQRLNGPRNWVRNLSNLLNNRWCHVNQTIYSRRETRTHNRSDPRFTWVR